MRAPTPPQQRQENSAFSAEGAIFPGFQVPANWPMAPSGDGRGSSEVQVQSPVPFVTPNLGGIQSPYYSGDGHGSRLAPRDQAAPSGVKTVGTPRGEAAKLAMLVVFFLLWISTASTLLFLYMDRYLFPG